MSDAHIDENTFDISIRKGACLLQTLHIISEKDLTELFFDFVIVEEYETAPIIEKTCCVLKTTG